LTLLSLVNVLPDASDIENSQYQILTSEE